MTFVDVVVSFLRMEPWWMSRSTLRIWNRRSRKVSGIGAILATIMNRAMPSTQPGYSFCTMVANSES